MAWGVDARFHRLYDELRDLGLGTNEAAALACEFLRQARAWR